MIYDTWSVALLACAAVSLFLTAVAVRVAFRVLRHWDLDSDSALQIALEEEIFLASTLMEMGLFIEVISVFLLVFAADSFSNVLVGAMCATGAFTANGYGIPTLVVKLFLLACSTGWIVLHRLDLHSEYYPLVKIKCTLLLFMAPLVIAGNTMLFLYLFNLEPEIITSCCGVIFGEQTGDGYNLLGVFPESGLMILYLFIITAVSASTALLPRLVHSSSSRRVAISLISLCCWCLFYWLSLVIITVIVSPYVYAMPHHRCPFDLLKVPHVLAGIPLYLFLHAALFSGIAAGIAGAVAGMPGLHGPARQLTKWSTIVSLSCLLSYCIAAAYRPLFYLSSGGEW